MGEIPSDPAAPHTASLPYPTCDDRAMRELEMSAFHFPALCVADELGLFTLLSDRGGLTRDEVSVALEIGSRAAEALLGVMTGLELLVQRQCRFQLTEVARVYLLPTSPYYRGGLFRIARGLPVSYERLLEAVRRDRPVVYGEADTWERHQTDAAQARAFTESMHSMSLAVAVRTAQRVDFSPVRWLLDVGGGSGSWCIALALANPALRCTVLDLEPVCAVAKENAVERGLGDRIDFAAADMFEDAWPTGPDGIFFGQILHDWPHARCLHLLRRAFDTLPPGGWVFANEELLNDTCDGPLPSLGNSLAMLLWTRGKQFTATELSELFVKAGFGEVTVTPTVGYWAIVSGQKPGAGGVQ